MKEIEFRAWDRTTKKEGVMVSWEELKKFPCEIVFLRLLEVIRMQYLGRKDKNGVKIFEGDSVIAISNKLKFYGYIKYDTETFAYCLFNKSGALDFLSAFSEFEIIGNIHENPELLK